MDDPQLQPRSEVAELYDRYPYPPVGPLSGLFRRIRWEERQTLNYRALYGAAFRSCAGAALRPRILVAGCGTFEPIVVALANPSAEIVAVDLSERSLALLRRQLRRRGLARRVLCLQADLTALPAALGTFDFIVATGVLHHLPDPAAGLRSLVARAGERAVFRFMVYSQWGRSLLYAAKELAAELGIASPAAFRSMIASLPAAHPYKIYFHLYTDAETDGGLADGFLHPCDQPFTAPSLQLLLQEAGLEAARFLHGPSGTPTPQLSGAVDWAKLTVLDAFGELEENFKLVARRSSGARNGAPTAWEWNEALPSRGPLYSRLLGKLVAFDKTVPPFLLGAARIEELAHALFLVPTREDA
jgi:SAM-dependent methyltransferase